jgi:hypothetical protein
MKAGKTLQELAAEIERRAAAKKDVVVASKDIRMATGGRLGDDTGLAIAGRLYVGINDHAHVQVGAHAGIPKPYYDKMRAEAPQLLCDNVNTWLARDVTDKGVPVKRMVRMMDGKARAFLSDAYRPLENEELARAVLPVLMEMDLAVMSCEITDRRLYIKAVDRKVERELAAMGGKFGDGQHKIVRCLSPAVTISNSEVGASALSVLGGVYDAFCSNLASFGERSVRKYHTGARHAIANEATMHLLSHDTMRKTNEALFAQVADITKAAFNRAHFDSLCDTIEETREHKIEGDPVKVIELATKQATGLVLSPTDAPDILRHLIEGGELNRFGLYNAITRASQDVDDYDRATDMERAGAKIIELKPAEWKRLAAAA